MEEQRASNETPVFMCVLSSILSSVRIGMWVCGVFFPLCMVNCSFCLPEKQLGLFNYRLCHNSVACSVLIVDYFCENSCDSADCNVSVIVLILIGYYFTAWWTLCVN